jgi:hypothetical protein
LVEIIVTINTVTGENTMGIELNITAADAEQLVKDTLLKDGLGRVISDAVSKSLSGYDSPIDRAIKVYVAEVASKLVREKFADQIKDAVIAVIESKVTQEVINDCAAKAVEKMIDAAHKDY